MMSEIYQRGPIVCSVATPADFTYGYRAGVYKDPLNYTAEEIDHNVEVSARLLHLKICGVTDCYKAWSIITHTWGRQADTPKEPWNWESGFQSAQSCFVVVRLLAIAETDSAKYLIMDVESALLH